MKNNDFQKKVRLERIKNKIQYLEKSGIVTWLLDEREDDWEAIYEVLALKNSTIGEIMEFRSAVLLRRSGR